MDGQPGELLLELEIVLPARRERIFAALTDPGRLARWWGPSGFTTPRIDVDARVGGSYRFTMKPPDGEPFHLAGRYLEIEPPCRLAFTFRWEEPTADDRETVVTLSLAGRVDETDETRVSLSQGMFATEERRTLHRNGWMESFVKLTALLQREAA